YGVEVPGDVGVGVEAQHRVRFGQVAGEGFAVPFGEATDRDDFAAAVVRGEQRVDRVAFGRLDEPAGVDDDRVGVGGVVDQRPAAGLQPRGELFGIDVVA